MAIYEMAILGRATWNLHSLSNEGTVGNVTEPRTIVLADGRATDGISGEMLKHMHAENMWALEKDKSKFCEACKVLDPMKANKIFREKGTKKVGVKEAIVKSIQTCMLCDVHGFLIEKPTCSRQSAVEFGWALGIPTVYKDVHVHARQAIGERGVKKEGKKVAPVQMLYYRPTRSGIYAVISVLQPWRIGLSNVDYNYCIGDLRKSRYQASLKAYQAMFMRPEGAMTSTRLPHTENFDGTIVISETNVPVPVISPLKNNYKDEIKAISNDVGAKTVEFKSLSEFVKCIKNLLAEQPYKL